MRNTMTANEILREMSRLDSSLKLATAEYYDPNYSQTRITELSHDIIFQNFWELEVLKGLLNAMSVKPLVRGVETYFTPMEKKFARQLLRKIAKENR